MELKQAKQTADYAYYANAILNKQLLNLQGNVDKEEFDEIKQRFGVVMGDILFEILDPIFKEHPELKPIDIGGTATRMPNSDFDKIFELIQSLSE